jgi:hypothetical protein
MEYLFNGVSMVDRDQIVISKLLGQVYNELFQRRPPNDNVGLRKSNHAVELLPTKEDTFQFLFTSASVTHIWGPGGGTDMATTSGDVSTRWGFGGIWA